MSNETRPLEPGEMALLRAITRGDWPGAEEVRGQIESARHAGWWFEGSQSFSLVVDPDCPLIPLPSDLIGPTHHRVYEDDEVSGGVLLWVNDGRLTSLEYYWFTPEMPSRLPEPAQLRATSEDQV
ncbi:MAG: hypothetical protein JWQ19_1490 [Subtercola sp.]|nr:hypothetical protein [Subtercola sp.]